MRTRFVGRFSWDGHEQQIGLEGLLDTTRLEAPLCQSVVTMNSEVALELKVGDSGRVEAKTTDNLQLTIDPARISTCETKADGSCEVELDVDSIFVESESAARLLVFDTASVRAQWRLSGHPELHRFLVSNESGGLASGLSEIIENHQGIEIGVSDFRRLERWDSDGIHRTEIEQSPYISVSWPVNALSPENYQSAVDRCARQIEDSALLLGLFIGVPIVVLESDIHAVQIGASFGDDTVRLINRRQALGRNPLSWLPKSRGLGRVVGKVGLAEGLRRLSQARGHLEQAINLFLWAPGLPIETEFINICTALEALKEWHLDNQSLQGVFKRPKEFARLAKCVRGLIRASSDLDQLQVPSRIAISKVAELSRPPLKWALQDLSETLLITEDELVTEFSYDFIRTRNRLVHTGAIEDPAEVQRSLDCARSLCGRMLFHIFSDVELSSSAGSPVVPGTSA